MEHNSLLTTVTEAQLVYRYSAPAAARPKVNTSVDAYQLLYPLFDACMDMREEFWMLLLDRGNRVKCAYRVSQGGMHGTVADPKLIFAAALKGLAAGILLAHNHPSGRATPSEEDVRLTRKLVEAGRLLDIAVHDHLIVTREGYYSFSDNGAL